MRPLEVTYESGAGDGEARADPEWAWEDVWEAEGAQNCGASKTGQDKVMNDSRGWRTRVPRKGWYLWGWASSLGKSWFL